MELVGSHEMFETVLYSSCPSRRSSPLSWMNAKSHSSGICELTCWQDFTAGKGNEYIITLQNVKKKKKEGKVEEITGQ